MSHRITVLWTVPRSVSTSFERMMIERGDHIVFDEPFSRSYYYGPERRSDRFTESIPASSDSELLDMLEKAAAERPVFVKDMAYHALGVLTPDVLGRFQNCFLVREPATALRSLSRRWPDFSVEEAGWDALGRAADVVESLGQPLVVVDAAELCSDPAGVVAAWCAAMDLPFMEGALTWEPGMRPEWELWSDWHTTTSESSGFRPLRDDAAVPDEPRLRDVYERANRVYRRLLEHAVRPDDPKSGPS
jgi:hypothetical protein